MFNALFAYFENRFPLTADDITLIQSVFVPRSMKKGEFLLREGQPGKYAAFVSKGFLRSYVTDSRGREHVIQFAPENWWISDKGPAAGSEASALFIDCVEDADILLLDIAGHNTLMEQLPGYAASFRTGMQKRTDAKDKRIVHALTASAQERYHDFLETFPGIASRVPQHMLASYLGITPETLSRIRRRSMQKK